MPQRRILHIAGGTAFGGIATVVAEATRAAREAGWTVDLVATDPQFRRSAAAAGAGIIDLDVAARPIRPLRDLRDLRRLTRFLREHRYDIIQTHTWKGSMLGRLAGRLARCPVVIVTAHGTPWSEASPALVVRAGALVERVAARWCSKIVTVSDFHRDWFIRLRIAPAEKFVTIRNALPNDHLQVTVPRADMRSSLGIGQEDLVVLYAGRLIPEKGILDLVAASRTLITTRGRGTVVLIAGEGPAAEEVQRSISRSGLEEHVRMLGFRSDMGNLLEAADLLVFPSHRAREGFPIALVEALAAGKPILASALGCNRELLEGGRGARLFEPGDISGLADALCELASAPGALRGMGVDARRLYLERYQPGSMHKAYVRLYEELAAAHRA